jgi:hypothetical protein
MSNAQSINRQWASRPADERYLSLPSMLTHAGRQQDLGRVGTTRVKVLRTAVSETAKELVLLGNTDTEARITNWAFSQLCQHAGAPAGYLQRLPDELARDCLNLGLSLADEESRTKLLVNVADDSRVVRAATGPDYGRIWNADVIRELMNHVGDGVTGDWKVPGEFGKDVPVTLRNTTLYMSDRDMFVALADEKNRIEIPNRRNGQTGSLARGVIISNSEVGAGKVRVATFLFDIICSNRCICGMEGWKEVELRHTRTAPDRWQDEVLPQVYACMHAELLPMQQTVRAAQQAHIGKEADVLAYLTKHLKVASDAKGAMKAHLLDEGRPIATIWDAVTGTTALAREQTYQSDRVMLERAAGRMLAQAA